MPDWPYFAFWAFFLTIFNIWAFRLYYKLERIIELLEGLQ